MDESKNIDSLLWKELKGGNLDALGKLYERHIDLLFSHGLRFTNDRNHVLDGVHDLFLDLYKYRKGLKETNNVIPYLLYSLKGKILKNGSKKLIPITDTKFLDYEENILDIDTSHEERIISEEIVLEKKAQLSFAKEFLTSHQEEAINLKYIKEKTYNEIAEIMKVSVPTSRTTVYRALKVLKKQMLTFLIVFTTSYF